MIHPHRRIHPHIQVPTTPACTWWNRPEEDNSSGKLESTHPSRTSVKSDQVFFGVESVMRVNADSLLIRAAATSTSGTLNDLTTDLIMANNNNTGVTQDSKLSPALFNFYTAGMAVSNSPSHAGILCGRHHRLNISSTHTGTGEWK